MRIRNIYLTAGLIGGLGLGIIPTFLTTGAAGGFAWLFIIGDSPSHLQTTIGFTVILTTFFATWVATIVIGTLVGLRAGKKAENNPDIIHARKRAVRTLLHILMSIAVVLSLLLFYGWNQKKQSQQQKATDTAEQQYVESLRSEAHKITAILLVSVTENSALLSVTTQGTHAGAYKLTITIEGAPYTESSVHTLATGMQTIPVTITGDKLTREFIRKLTTAQMTTGYSGSTMLTARLEPILDRNLQYWYEPITSTISIPVSLAFTVRNGIATIDNFALN